MKNFLYSVAVTFAIGGLFFSVTAFFFSAADNWKYSSVSWSGACFFYYVYKNFT